MAEQPRKSDPLEEYNTLGLSREEFERHKHWLIPPSERRLKWNRRLVLGAIAAGIVAPLVTIGINLTDEQNHVSPIDELGRNHLHVIEVDYTGDVFTVETQNDRCASLKVMQLRAGAATLYLTSAKEQGEEVGTLASLDATIPTYEDMVQMTDGNPPWEKPACTPTYLPEYP